jgi:UDP-N-acetylmuramoyl-tripeptide--D-alanyl-D-alanine ligase
VERPYAEGLVAVTWTLADVAEMAGGRLSEPSAGARSFDPARISLDSRSLRPGDFFVALRGERHDGHDHLETARAAGALGALVDRPLAVPGFPQVLVDDSLRGWQDWAAAHRRRFPDLPLLGLTGSSGKTSAKDLVRHLLDGAGAVLATEGNRNNHVGVPWTLLGLRPEHRFAVVEMGMNHPGEIARLSTLAAPSAAFVTDVGTAHVGHLGSREAILAAKLEILEGMEGDGPLILPHDPWILERLPGAARRRSIRTFGLDPAADWHPEGRIAWSLTATRFTVPGIGAIEVPLLGPGAVLSTLAALSSVDGLGLPVGDLAPGLATAPRRELRMEPRDLRGIRWVLDCYNASPESSRLAISFLRAVSHEGRRLLVLGELGELGAHAEAIHRDLGARAAGLDGILFVGEGARAALEAARAALSEGRRDRAGADAWASAMGGEGFSGPAVAPRTTLLDWVPDAGAAAGWLRGRLRDGDLVLLKGSRRMGLERILDVLDEPAGPGAARGES